MTDEQIARPIFTCSICGNVFCFYGEGQPAPDQTCLGCNPWFGNPANCTAEQNAKRAQLRGDGLHLHQCGWCGEWYNGARVDHGCPPPPVSAMEQDYIDSFDKPDRGGLFAAAHSAELRADIAEVREGWFQNQTMTNEAAAPVAEAMVDEFLQWVDQTNDYTAHMLSIYGAEMRDTLKDWRDIRGDLDI